MSKVDDGLRALLQRNIPDAHWQSLETWTSLGVPDSNVCLSGTEIWIECKAARHWRAVLRPHQVGWHRRRALAGGRVFVAVRRRSRGRREKFDELWLVRSDRVERVVDLSDPATSVVGRWRGGPRRWPWSRVRAALLGAYR